VPWPGARIIYADPKAFNKKAGFFRAFLRIPPITFAGAKDAQFSDMQMAVDGPQPKPPGEVD
jgi:hypothetical protein